MTESPPKDPLPETAEDRSGSPPVNPPRTANRNGMEPTAIERDRIRACGEKIMAACKEFECQIRPGWGPRVPVGTTGDTFMQTAVWDLVAVRQV